MSGGEIALIILAASGAVLVLFLSLTLISLIRNLENSRVLIDNVRQQTVPLLSEVTKTVTGVNRELDRVDGIVASAANITKSVERLTVVIEKTVSNPLVKAVAFAAGASKAMKRLRGSK